MDFKRKSPPRVTPRNSITGEDEQDTETPYATLVQLARAVNKPQTPDQSAPRAAQRRSVRRTPGAGRLNPRPPAKSPHTIRAIEQRTATPGRGRRKSGKYRNARETPRDLLRALSRQLLPVPEPQLTPVHLPATHRASDMQFYNDIGHASDDGDDTLPPPPRLSMSLGDLDSDSNDDDIVRINPPRLSLPLDESEVGTHSMEVGRRALSEQPYFGRSSFGIRLSDRFADFNDVEMDTVLEEDDIQNESLELTQRNEQLSLGNAIALDGHISLVDDEHTRTSEADEISSRIEYADTEPTFFLPIPNGVDEHGAQSYYGIGTSSTPAAGSRIAGVHLASATASPVRKKLERQLPNSRHGIAYAPFPRKITKQLAVKFSGSAITRETLNSLVTASEMFFQQVSEDLSVYARHAMRKTVDDADIIQLLKRQRQITHQTTPFALAQRHLPRELLQEVRMRAPTKRR